MKYYTAWDVRKILGKHGIPKAKYSIKQILHFPNSYWIIIKNYRLCAKGHPIHSWATKEIRSKLPFELWIRGAGLFS